MYEGTQRRADEFLCLVSVFSVVSLLAVPSFLRFLFLFLYLFSKAIRL
jgi:hypothetical protein